MEFQAYGCIESDQIPRAYMLLDELIKKWPDKAKYYFDYGMTMIRHDKTLDIDKIKLSQEYLRKACELSQYMDGKIIKGYISLLMDAAFGNKDMDMAEAKELCELYCKNVLGN